MKERCYNPTYQSGLLAVFLLGLVVLSGVPLLFLYHVGNPYGSMQTIQEQAWLGRWLRALHRYASDAAVVAIGLHLARMMIGNRTAGPRTRAWVSGLVLTVATLAVGVIGLVLVWDEQAQRLATAVARWLDVLPLFSEPPRRIFAENSQVGEAFFFMLIFLHVALPLLLVFLLVFHTSRLARARFLPEPYLMRYYGAAVLLLAVSWPVPLGKAADLLTEPEMIPLDWFYAFWLPLGDRLGWGGAFLTLGLVLVVLVSIPWWWDRSPRPASQVDESSCTGCTHCYQDCPYDAISMVARSEHRDSRHSELVARVDPSLCVSCGICAASCAPMGVGPPARTGKDQLRAADEFASQRSWKEGEIVVLACRWGHRPWPSEEGICWYNTGCSGSVHTSVVEIFLRRGAAGVLVLSCPERDCRNREGPKWLQMRVYQEREAELQARVDRRRVRLFHGRNASARLAREFRQEVLGLGAYRPLEEGAASCKTSNAGS